MNRLAKESSPYLLQHASNPIDWFPWGEEALNLARELDRPIFLSIGYSSCHWCHVMEKESFSDPEVGELLNRCFVSVKVDREERPDLDAQYMAAAQILTGQGGWPLNLILTPRGVPVFAFSFLPPRSREGLPGLLDILWRMANMWKQQRGLLEEIASRLLERLWELVVLVSPLEGNPADAREKAFEILRGAYDEEFGGFGSGPKFPEPALLFFLMSLYQREGNRKALEMIERTLLAIRAGGIYDQVGWGVHRYATDVAWRVPHFEKMLSDQALMSMVYLQAWQITGGEIYSKTVHEILEYVLRDLRNRDGVFYSAQDADSEGKEGTCYLWSYDELRDLFDDNEFARLCKSVEVFSKGNFHIFGAGNGEGNNILFIRQPPLGKNGQFDSLRADRLYAQLIDDDLRVRLFRKRFERPKPSLDRKIITAANGLMIAALARAARAFGESSYLEVAYQAANWLLENHKSDGFLIHHSIDGKAGGPALAEDYAFLIWGLLELYQAGGRKIFLDTAQVLSQQLMDNFTDHGVLFMTSAHQMDCLFRMPADSDSSVPSAAAVQFQNLRSIAMITGDATFHRQAQTLAGRLNYLAGKYPGALLYYLAEA